VTCAQRAADCLVEGRLVVEQVTGDLVVASCRDDSGEVYRLGHDPQAQEWRCTCAIRGTCPHLHALQLVTVRRTPVTELRPRLPE
jgi:hypothetical protein